MRANSWRRGELLAIAVLAASAIALAVLGIDVPLLRALLGLPLALFVPGYALVAALFPRSAGDRMRNSTRILFAIGTSIVLTILTSFGLNFTPPGIQWISLAFALGGLTLALCAAADWRLTHDGKSTAVIPAARPNLPMAIPAPYPNAGRQPALAGAAELARQLRVRGFGPAQLAVLAIALAIAAGAISYAVNVARQVQSPDVVQLWMLPVDGAPQPNTVRFGVRNLSATESRYRLEVSRGGYTLQEWREIDVPIGATWEVTATLDAASPGSGPVSALLYPPETGTQPLRRVQYWLE